MMKFKSNRPVFAFEGHLPRVGAAPPFLVSHCFYQTVFGFARCFSLILFFIFKMCYAFLGDFWPVTGCG
jgi:hypothetical protein